MLRMELPYPVSALAPVSSAAACVITSASTRLIFNPVPAYSPVSSQLLLRSSFYKGSLIDSVTTTRSSCNCTSTNFGQSKTQLINNMNFLINEVLNLILLHALDHAVKCIVGTLFDKQLIKKLGTLQAEASRLQW